MKKSLFIAAIVGFAIASTANAADLSGDFNATDTNMDGFISQQELLSFQQHNMTEQNQQIFEVLDADENGEISRQEYLDFYENTQLTPEAKQQLAKKFSELDTDNDGIISAAEMDEFRKSSMVEDNRDLFNAMDTNADKKVSHSEFNKFFGTMGQILGN